MAERYTTSEAIAWEYVLNARSRELSATEALRQYRSGGGHIRDADWYFLYRSAADAEYAQELSQRLPEYLYPSRDAFQYTPWRMEEKYIVKARVTARDSEGNIYPSFWRTVESGHNLTMKQWKEAVVDYLTHDPSIPDITDVDIESLTFYTTEEWGIGYEEE